MREVRLDTVRLTKAIYSDWCLEFFH